MTSRIVVRTGDLFKDAPAGSILLHACNCYGSWGGGIALAFKAHFPLAYAAYKNHCNAQKDDPRVLVGTTLIIRDEDADKKGYDIGCLFTSKGHGRSVDSPDQILIATKLAIEDLMKQNDGKGIYPKRPIHACKFNSGLFRVPWEDTQAVLEDLGVQMIVHVPPDE